MRGVPVIVFANKQDLLGAVSEAELVDHLQLMNIKDRKWQIQLTSAKTSMGLTEGMQWVSKVLEEERNKPKGGIVSTLPFGFL